MLDYTVIRNTNDDYSCHDILPAPEPKTISPPIGYFYHNVAKHLIKDTVRIMNNGLGIDLEKVEKLEATLDDQLKQVEKDLASNPLVKKFQELQYAKKVSEYVELQKSKLKTPEDFIKPFKFNDMNHRSYFMYLFANKQQIAQPTETLDGSDIPKWPVNLVKKFVPTYPLLGRLLKGELKHSLIDEAMLLMAKHKCEIYNRAYFDKIANPDVELPMLNPNSPTQKQELFEWLGIKSDKISKRTGLPSFDRDEIERINKETLDADVKHFTQCFIDHSYAAIVRNNFIEAFYKYSIDNRLYGTLKLGGAKTFRYTSSNPNLLNMPSSKSAFAKPIKQCFVAPKGFLVAAIDYAALEDKVIANLTKDQNKIITQTDREIDGHLFHATIYFKKQFQEILGNLSHRELTIAAKTALDAKDTRIKKLRDISKNVTFGASYGAHPPKIAAQIKCPLEEAEHIFNAYHNEMYPGITDYRENYVLPTAIKNGNIHLGLGFKISSDNPKKDIRTLNNATAQFWSILTLLSINKIHQLIDKAGYQNDIIVTSSIYDSIYFEVRNDPIVIKWLNNTLVPIMTTDFMENQIVHNEADLELGLDWATLHKLPHNASIEDIENIIKEIHA